MADTYQVKGKPRKVFLERFDYENWGKSDTEIKNISGVPSIETYKKHANTIYKQFSKDKPNGCPRLDSSDPGAGKFEILRTWLQETMYPQWLTEQQSKVSSSSPVDIDWREVCGKVLARQREEQRLRRQATERGFELNVYVPLGLVERKQQQRRNGDVPLEEVYQLTEEVITKEYDNDKFLAEVIEPGKSRRIAIIGEPGAGKTTLQEKIAVWIHDNNKGLPICIPLGGLQGKSLEDYLVQIWLKTALRFIEPDALGVEAQHIASLQKQFRESKVWLLLDGVDEMAATSPVEALATIKEQLTDWLAEARVVLTCRLNVWDANANNLLTGFETYRTLEFKPEQVEDFIRQWFACAKESQRGEELLRKLQETGKERIRELVRNPLRLSLLCQTSYVLPVYEPLPETKAALYERFTRYFYEWKQEQHLELTQQDELIDELHEALGKLALAGINSTARFRLGRKLARQEMGDRLFNLACRLGWLNLVDRDAKTDDAVYAFFHPTFQEYFAACAIDDWHFFLNHVPDNPMQGTYRIFEPQWKEVILLWLGQEGNNDFSQQKQRFIRSLIEFKDGCFELIIRNYGFYEYRAYFLAAAGISEFRECMWADEIIKQLLKWSFGTEIQEGSWPDEMVKSLVKSGARQGYAPRKIEDKAKEILLETDRSMAIDGLIELTRNSPVEDIRREVVESLGQIGKGSPKVKVVLFELIHNSCNDHTCMKAAESLGKIDPGNKQAIATLVNLIYSSTDDYVRSKARLCLGEIAPDHHEAAKLQSSNWFEELAKADHIDPSNSELIRSLVNEISSTPNKTDKYYLMRVVQNLGHTLPGDPEAIKALINLIDTTVDEHILREAVGSLGRVGKSNPEAIALLINLIRNSKNESIRRQAVMSLRHTETSYEEVIWMLIDVIRNIPPGLCRMPAANSLGQILERYPLDSAVSALQNCLFTLVGQRKNFELYSIIYDVLWHCTQNLPYPDFYQAWHQT
ncbi:MAG TPA: HEAT repeat domain-containing protein, partial [Candidatus Sericytochromatia bacterium]